MKIIPYFRVSTEKQGQSGLGLEGQQAAVDTFATSRTVEVLASYTEIESATGKRKRPELNRAIVHCRREGATLVIAKLDRLARNVFFVSGLMESGVEFIACDIPSANRLTVHILMAVAEDETRRISERTKTALRAYKARGGLLGAHRPGAKPLTDEARRKGSDAVRDLATVHVCQILPTMLQMRQAGATLQAIADHLNADGRLTIRSKLWTPVAVMRVLNRQPHERNGSNL